jgi:glycosyltransferase involved in cell wall biosynthesis
MHVLFVHRAFPAQFGRLAQELTDRYGWQCTFLVEHLSRCPAPSEEMLRKVTLHRLPAQRPSASIPWPQTHGHTLELGRSVFEAVRARPELRPDLVVGHGGLTPTLLLRDLLDCPFVDYCEYYFAPTGRDLSYRIDLPDAEPAPFYPRCINATTLLSLAACNSGYAPTRWQRAAFPERFRSKIEVHFDGLDTELYRPRPDANDRSHRGGVLRTLTGQTLPPETRIVTYAARGLESVRGFDLFMEVAQRIQRVRPDVLFVVAGNEEIYYGWDNLRTGGQTFKEWVLQRGGYDLSRFVFLNHVAPEQLAEVFCLSDLHIYLTVPFVLSWSLLDALACGCVVLAADVEPVREVIEAGRNGLVEPLFDTERLAETALRVLDDPGAYRPLAATARALIEEKYSLEVTVPALADYFERVVSTRGRLAKK